MISILKISNGNVARTRNARELINLKQRKQMSENKAKTILPIGSQKIKYSLLMPTRKNVLVSRETEGTYYCECLEQHIF